MTERQGVFPPEGTEDGTFHWLKPEHGPAQLYMWHIRAWFFPGQARGKDHEAMGASKFSYLGPAPTYEQSQADAADARRFRFLLSMWWKGDALRDFFHTNVEDDRIIAAIDAEMMERAMTDRHRPNHSRRKESIVIAAPERDWPAGCYDPTSCERHRMCMYLHCIHTGLGAALGDAIDAAMKGDSNE